MNILGDIGNSETKVFLVNNDNKILKYIVFPSKKLTNKILSLIKTQIKKIEKKTTKKFGDLENQLESGYTQMMQLK